VRIGAADDHLALSPPGPRPYEVPPGPLSMDGGACMTETRPNYSQAYHKRHCRAAAQAAMVLAPHAPDVRMRPGPQLPAAFGRPGGARATGRDCWRDGTAVPTWTGDRYPALREARRTCAGPTALCPHGSPEGRRPAASARARTRRTPRWSGQPAAASAVRNMAWRRPEA
jgi:hypothetical protein